MIDLGVSYIAFSGLELLKPSLLNIRPFAKYICVVWSPLSSTGEPIAEYAQDLLESLEMEGLIDELIEFQPKRANNPQEMQDNCRIKREIGRITCQAAGCTHHLLRDCDEFHDTAQLKAVLGNYPDVDCTLTRIRDYVNNPCTVVKEVSSVCVPFVQKIGLKLTPRHRPFNCMCDGGRTVAPVHTWKMYTPEELILHHLTFVRYSETELCRKYQGHGHCHRIGNLGQFMAWAKRFKPGELAQVQDQFGILEYWKNEFELIQGKKSC